MGEHFQVFFLGVRSSHPYTCFSAFFYIRRTIYLASAHQIRAAVEFGGAIVNLSTLYSIDAVQKEAWKPFSPYRAALFISCLANSSCSLLPSFRELIHQCTGINQLGGKKV